MYRRGCRRFLYLKVVVSSCFLAFFLSACQIEIISSAPPKDEPPPASSTSTPNETQVAAHQGHSMLAPPAPEEQTVQPPVTGVTHASAPPVPPPIGIAPPLPGMPPVPPPGLFPPPSEIPAKVFQGELVKASLTKVESCSKLEASMLDKWMDSILMQDPNCPGCVYGTGMMDAHYADIGVRYTQPPPILPIPTPSPISGGIQGENQNLLSDDKGFVYALANGKLKVMQALPSGEMSLRASFDPAMPARGIYLDSANQQVLVLGERVELRMPEPIMVDTAMPMPHMPRETRSIVIGFIDVSNPDVPQTIRHVEISGMLWSSRQRGDYFYIASRAPMDIPSDLWQDTVFVEAIGNYRKAKELADMYQFVLDNSANAPSDELITFAKGTQELVDKLRAILLSRISSAITDGMTGLLPTVTTSEGGSSSVSALLSCEEILLLDGDAPQQSLFTISKIRLSNASLSALGVLAPISDMLDGEGDTFYLSAPTVMMGNTIKERERTTLFKIDANDDGLVYSASGVVPGMIDNPGALDEVNGLLRVFSNEYATDESSSMGYQSSHLTIMRDNGGRDMETISQVINFSPSQFISKVKYSGSRAYVIASGYRTGLYAFDLSDMTNPRHGHMQDLGRFDGYINTLNETSLFTVSHQFDEITGKDGLQLRLYNASDLNNVVMAHSHTITSLERSYFWTPVLHDPTLMNLDLPSGTVFFPLEQDSWESRSFTRAMIGFELDMVTGIRGLGSVDLMQVVNGVTAGCSPTTTGLAPPCFPPMYDIGMQTRMIGSTVLRDKQNDYLFVLSNAGASLHELDKLDATVGKFMFDDSPFAMIQPIM